MEQNAPLTLLAMAAGVLVLVVAQALRARRWQDDAIDHSRCLACGGETLLERHAEAWACCACGYEQGPGWQRRRDAEHLEALARLSPEEAARLARAHLTDARLLLEGVLSTFAHPVVVERRQHGDVRTVNPDMLDALGDARQAQRQLQEAGMLSAEVGEALASAGFDSQTVFPDVEEAMEGTLGRYEAVASEAHGVLSTCKAAADQAVRFLGLGT